MTKRRTACRVSEMAKLLAYLTSLQDVQKHNPPTTAAWQRASKEIHLVAKRLTALSKRCEGRK